MKNLLFLAAAAILTFALNFCKNTPLPEGQTIVSENTPAETQSQPNTPLPAGKSDSLVGFKGCERAAWSPVSATSDEFIYQHYIVKKIRIANNPGEWVTVLLRDSAQASFVVPMPTSGYFYGITRNKLFVDVGTGPDGRELLVFDIDKKIELHRTPYYGDPQVIQSDRLHYLLPAEEKDVTKMPDCPDKEQWVKDGLRVGYGQRCIFNLSQRTLTRKSEWACVQLQ